MGIYKSGRPIKYNPHTHAGTPPPPLPGEYRMQIENNHFFISNLYNI